MYTKEDLKKMAQVVLFNTGSAKSTNLLTSLAFMYKTHPQVILDEIKKLVK